MGIQLKISGTLKHRSFTLSSSQKKWEKPNTIKNQLKREIK